MSAQLIAIRKVKETQLQSSNEIGSVGRPNTRERAEKKAATEPKRVAYCRKVCTASKKRDNNPLLLSLIDIYQQIWCGLRQ